ncbi:hypothetical protein MKW98_011451 [Papaver atlanticum]|uniref:Uncharacterized protein n=1 Tax=Papaver atlanticum TaxID=357466 RepID=A0AAD4RWS6_9MAGN|nr:hypothetical protein MKW98_011451 [Papaver atlanticum]
MHKEMGFERVRGDSGGSVVFNLSLFLHMDTFAKQMFWVYPTLVVRLCTYWIKIPQENSGGVTGSFRFHHWKLSDGDFVRRDCYLINWELHSGTLHTPWRSKISRL